MDTSYCAYYNMKRNQKPYAQNHRHVNISVFKTPVYNAPKSKRPQHDRITPFLMTYGSPPLHASGPDERVLPRLNLDPRLKKAAGQRESH